jgi:hypothetical protein
MHDDAPQAPDAWHAHLWDQVRLLQTEQRHLHACVETHAVVLQQAVDALAQRIAPLETLRSILYGVGIGIVLVIGAVLALLPWLVRVGQILERKP